MAASIITVGVNLGLKTVRLAVSQTGTMSIFIAFDLGDLDCLVENEGNSSILYPPHLIFPVGTMRPPEAPERVLAVRLFIQNSNNEFRVLSCEYPLRRLFMRTLKSNGGLDDLDP